MWVFVFNYDKIFLGWGWGCQFGYVFIFRGAKFDMSLYFSLSFYFSRYFSLYFSFSLSFSLTKASITCNFFMVLRFLLNWSLAKKFSLSITLTRCPRSIFIQEYSLSITSMICICEEVLQLGLQLQHMTEVVRRFFCQKMGYFWGGSSGRVYLVSDFECSFRFYFGIDVVRNAWHVVLFAVVVVVVVAAVQVGVIGLIAVTILLGLLTKGLLQRSTKYPIILPTSRHPSLLKTPTRLPICLSTCPRTPWLRHFHLQNPKI